MSIFKNEGQEIRHWKEMQFAGLFLLDICKIMLNFRVLFDFVFFVFHLFATIF